MSDKSNVYTTQVLVTQAVSPSVFIRHFGRSTTAPLSDFKPLSKGNISADCTEIMALLEMIGLFSVSLRSFAFKKKDHDLTKQRKQITFKYMQIIAYLQHPKPSQRNVVNYSLFAIFQNFLDHVSRANCVRYTLLVHYDTPVHLYFSDSIMRRKQPRKIEAYLRLIWNVT